MLVTVQLFLSCELAKNIQSNFIHEQCRFELNQVDCKFFNEKAVVKIYSHYSADNAHALFVRATYLSCHRLISSWKTDLNVSLAALELLSGLARMHIKDSGEKITQLN